MALTQEQRLFYAIALRDRSSSVLYFVLEMGVGNGRNHFDALTRSHEYVRDQLVWK